MKYILDTNIVLTYLRGGKSADFIESLEPFRKREEMYISIATVAELKSIARRNDWGLRKLKLLNNFISEVIVIDIKFEKLVNIYVEIDHFSQKGEKDGKPFSARNMGKNDIWIAATAALVDAKLITADKDFNHLDKVFFDLILVDL